MKPYIFLKMLFVLLKHTLKVIPLHIRWIWLTFRLWLLPLHVSLCKGLNWLRFGVITVIHHKQKAHIPRKAKQRHMR